MSMAELSHLKDIAIARLCTLTFLLTLLNSAYRASGNFVFAGICDKLTCLLDANSGNQNVILTP